MDEKKKTQNAAGKIIPDLYDRIKAAADDFDRGIIDGLSDILYTLIEGCAAANVSVIATAATELGPKDMVMAGGDKGKVALNVECISTIMGQILEGQDPQAIEIILRVFVRNLTKYLPFADFEVETRQADGPRKKGS